jgi:hypothetical protein
LGAWIRSAARTVTLLQATFHFELRRLCIARELLGTAHDLERQGRRVRITFPETERPGKDSSPEIDPAIFPNSEPLPLIEGAGDVYTSGTVMHSDDFAVVDAVRVQVIFDGPASAASYEDPGESDAHTLASQTSWGAMEEAQSVVEALITWLRVVPGQFWLGLSGESPWPAGRSRLEDMDAGRRLPYSFSGRRRVIQRIADEAILNSQSLGPILKRVEVGEEPSLASSCLADAWFLNSHSSDAPRVVLTAAIACELRVKQALRDLAKPDAADLVDVLLENPRDHSMAAATLFHKPMAAVAGVSLREADRELWKRVSRVFEIRNDIAHRGYTPTAEEALESLQTATQAFRWLNTLR